MLEDVLKNWGGHEVDAMSVYSSIFHLDEHLIQSVNEPSGLHKANPIIVGSFDGKPKRRIMFEDTFEETLREFQEADWAVMNGLTYWGKANTAANQSKMYAMIFDLDGVTDTSLDNFLRSATSTEFDIYPRPQYVILSGNNVHLYYVFDEPLSLYPNTKIQLKKLKYALIDRMWNVYTSEEYEHVQHQGINQGFRIVGGKTKRDGVQVRAFRLSGDDTHVNDLNKYVVDDAQIDISKIWKESKLTLAEAAEKYPEWYERRIVQNDTSPARWHVKRDLYDWWLKRIKTEASFRHRYFCIMCLAIYAAKCPDVTREELERDAIELIPYFNTLSLEPFTEADVASALECYDERYCTFPRSDMAKLSALPMQASKRNGRKQDQHLKIVNATRSFRRDVLGENEYAKNGRPKGSGTKQQQVAEWRKAHPDGRKIDCERDTGLSRHTVLKWWQDDVKNGKKCSSL